MRERRSLILTAMIFLGCQSDPVVPKVQQDPVSIQMTVSTQSLKIGDPDTIRVTIRNNLTQAVRLIFDSSCQVFVTIRSQAGDVVTPRDGRPSCLPVQTQLILQPNGTSVVTSIWTGGYDFKPPDTQEKVPAGAYFVSAQLIALGYTTLAPAYRVDVVP